MESIVDDLLSTDPNWLYTEDCANLALRLPGTLADDRSAWTLWCRSRTMLTLAACYPRMLASKNEFNTAGLDLLITLGVCTDFRQACECAMLFVNPGKILDVASNAYCDYARSFPGLDMESSANWLAREMCDMMDVYALCRTFYFGTGYDYENMAAARKLADVDFAPLYTKTRLLKDLLRAMMAAARTPHLFDKLKCIFLKVLEMWDRLTPRLKSCAKVTLELCGNVQPHMMVKLMASLLREVWSAGGFCTNEFHHNDENLLLLTSVLSSENVYHYNPDITLVCNIKRRCVGVLTKRTYSDHIDVSTKRMNMLAYAVMESARKINCADFPITSPSEEPSKSTFKLEYVKVDGVPSDEDDVENYIAVDKLTTLSAKDHGFAVWNKSHRKLEYREDITC